MSCGSLRARLSDRGAHRRLGDADPGPVRLRIPARRACPRRTEAGRQKRPSRSRRASRPGRRRRGWAAGSGHARGRGPRRRTGRAADAGLSDRHQLRPRRRAGHRRQGQRDQRPASRATSTFTRTTSSRMSSRSSSSRSRATPPTVTTRADPHDLRRGAGAAARGRAPVRDLLRRLPRAPRLRPRREAAAHRLHPQEHRPAGHHRRDVPADAVRPSATRATTRR